MKKAFFSLATITLIFPAIIYAQVNQSLINLPINNQDSFSSYINLLYALSISAAGLLAVIKIIIAGVKYMLTDVVTSKGDAIREIKGALLGLLLILGAVLILTVINPKLANTSLQFDPQPVPRTVTTPAPITANPSNPSAPTNVATSSSVTLGTGYQACAQQSQNLIGNATVVTFSVSTCEPLDKQGQKNQFTSWCAYTVGGTIRIVDANISECTVR